MIEWIHLEERISDLMIIAQSKCLAFDLGKVQFLELYLQVVSKTVVAATLTTSVCRIRDNFLIHLSRFDQVLSFRIHIYWKLMDTKIPTIWITKVNEPFLFSNHCLLMMLLPQFCIPLNEVFF
jgi:hypothetical protein